MDWHIENPVKLEFDPFGENTREEIKKVFGNKLARILWMGIRQQGYLVNQDFEKDCLTASEMFGRFGIPESADGLRIMLQRQFSTIYQKEFTEELLPYLLGDKNLEYTIINDNL